MSYGIAGIHGNRGIVVSVSYSFYWVLKGPNPTLSANISASRTRCGLAL